MKIAVLQKGFNYSQDGPGNRLVLHLQGCNLHCPWCSNPESMAAATAFEETEDVLALALRSRPMMFDGGGVTFTGGGHHRRHAHGAAGVAVRQAERKVNRQKRTHLSTGCVRFVMQKKSFGQAFTKACGFQRQRLWAPTAVGEILTIRKRRRGAETVRWTVSAWGTLAGGSPMRSTNNAAL